MSRHNHIERYPVERWAEYGDLQKLRGMNAHQAVERSRELRKRFARDFSMETITTFGLDNPYASDDARAVMLSDRQRIDGFRKGAR